MLESPTGERGWRIAFFVGLILTAFMLSIFDPSYFSVTTGLPWLVYPIAGLLVGFGTRMGGGCTSGHGVCGIGRLSKRSIVATITFIAAGAITVSLVKAIRGGAL